MNGDSLWCQTDPVFQDKQCQQNEAIASFLSFSEKIENPVYSLIWNKIIYQ